MSEVGRKRKERIEIEKVKRCIDKLSGKEMLGRHWKGKGGMLASEWIFNKFKDFGFTDKLEGGVKGQPYVTRQIVEKGASPNIIGYVPGKEKEKLVIIGAHYDHLGLVGGDCKGEIKGRRARDSSFCNGADDNASGIAALLLVIRLVLEEKRRRSNIIFIATTGEEFGLKGAKFFVNDLLKNTSFLPKDSLAINMDMVSRGVVLALDEGKKETGVCKWLTNLSSNSTFNGNSFSKIEINQHPEWIPRSDQEPYYKKKFNCLLISRAEERGEDHIDYHSIRDEPHLLKEENYKYVIECAHLAFLAAKLW